MKVTVEILQNCGEYRVGDRVTLDAKRAQRLERTGYARVLKAPTTETATTEPEDKATAPVRRREQRG